MRRGLKIITLTFLLPVMLLAGYIVFLLATGNFHVITGGEAYRSAQLSGNKLSQYIEEYHIKSVLNLRGQNAGQKWYEDEINTCSKLGVQHYDIALSSRREPKMEDIAKLFTIFAKTHRPILIHCQYGADRSGLVAAMWKVSVDNEPKSEANKQLSIFYGHVPMFGREAMDHFFEKWDPAIQYSY